MTWRAALKAYSRTSLPARGPGCLGLRKGLRTCMLHVLRWCCCCCFIGHPPTSIGLATSNGFSVQEEACLPFLNPVNSCILSSLDKTSDTSAGGAGAWEPGSILAEGWTSTASCPSSFLEIGFWSVSRAMHLSLHTIAPCPLPTIRRSFTFPSRVDGSLNQEHFLWPSPLKLPLNWCCN